MLRTRSHHRLTGKGRSRPARWVLLIGTPGTGKRPIGAYLEQEAGFVHLDFGNDEVRESLLGSTTTELRARAAALTTALVAGGTNGGRPVRVAVAAHSAHTVSAPHVAALPRRGVLVSGHSLAGVRLGDTMAAVKHLWGGHFTKCGGCKPAMWF